jgi:hypothetical protein
MSQILPGFVTNCYQYAIQGDGRELRRSALVSPGP